MTGLSLKPLKFLFVPVSSTKGIGEYMRCLIVADAITRRWPNANVRFILSRHAPYASDCPYPAALIDNTPTKSIPAVNEQLSEYRPDMVIFDASGRSAQLRHAKRCGAKVVFISQHRRKRRRGLKWRRLQVTDCHWVVQPAFLMGKLSWFERCKLALQKKAAPACIGPVFCPPDLQRQQALLAQYDLPAQGFWFFNAGSGGHRLQGKLAADTFAAAAAALYQRTGIACVMVFGSNYPHALPQHEGVIGIASIDNMAFISLLAAAKGAVLAGGDTLLQALALHIPAVAVAVAPDQHARVKRCVSQTLCLQADAKADALACSAMQLQVPALQQRLKQQMASQGLHNGLDVMMAQIETMLPEHS
ncbi:hypothetical protein [Shewanella sp. YIC-542]|uniref:hypothetical protein n=1 Tax=Shewanella mytili TaxID=3377111 RepID=UPI00398F735E